MVRRNESSLRRFALSALKSHASAKQFEVILSNPDECDQVARLFESLGCSVDKFKLMNVLSVNTPRTVDAEGPLLI